MEVGLKLNVAPEMAGTPDAIVRYSTKAVDDPENSAETNINNVCVYQFLGTDDSATLIGTVEYIEDYDSNDPSRSTVKLVASNETCTVVVLTNTFSQVNLSGENQTLGGLKQRLMGVSSQSDLF
ncbi:MAG: hypothetical protein Q4G10_04920, partial [Bacteroidia bacterium]|nr:hypothetical protein [Bacteroidia bacterium]